MVICIVALVVFGILGIFSAKHRKMFFEALHCLKRNITLRPCETGFDRRMKYKIASRFHNYPKAYSFIYRHFNIFSWFLVITLFASFAIAARGGYYLITEKTCDPDNPENCPFADLAGYNATEAECEKSFEVEIETDKCAVPAGYTEEKWREHMSHHPDRYKECLEAA